MDSPESGRELRYPHSRMDSPESGRELRSSHSRMDSESGRELRSSHSRIESPESGRELRSPHSRMDSPESGRELRSSHSRMDSPESGRELRSPHSRRGMDSPESGRELRGPHSKRGMDSPVWQGVEVSTQQDGLTRVWQGVEVSTQQEGDGVAGGVRRARPQARRRLLDDVLQLRHEDHRLDELHVAELRVPVDVARSHQQQLLRLAVRGQAYNDDVIIGNTGLYMLWSFWPSGGRPTTTT